MCTPLCPPFEQLVCRERVLGPKHVEVGQTLVRLGALLRLLGRGVDALRVYRRAVAVFSPALGPTHKDTVACQGAVTLLEKAHPGV
jgi:hypothetical protein